MCYLKSWKKKDDITGLVDNMSHFGSVHGPVSANFAERMVLLQLELDDRQLLLRLAVAVVLKCWNVNYQQITDKLQFSFWELSEHQTNSKLELACLACWGFKPPSAYILRIPSDLFALYSASFLTYLFSFLMLCFPCFFSGAIDIPAAHRLRREAEELAA